MNVQNAARMTMTRFKFPVEARAERSETGEGMNHCLYMLQQIRLGFVSGEKAHRWLGWAQCMIVHAGMGSLRMMKEINLEAE